jgi:hypothetical protein
MLLVPPDNWMNRFEGGPPSDGFLGLGDLHCSALLFRVPAMRLPLSAP